jgi:flagellar biogenesis protein FliO
VSALLVLVKTGMVFGLLAVVLFVLKKTDGLGGRARGGLLEVRGSTRLGKGATLTAVRVDGRDLLLGVTDHTVTLLSSEPAAAEEGQPARRTAGLKLSLPLQRKAELDPGAVAAALAALRGEPLPPRATDGPVASPRTEARPAEEQPCADHAVA